MGTEQIEMGKHPAKPVRQSKTILDLRMAGVSFEDIADVMGYEDEAEVRKELEKASAILLKENPETKAAVRDLVGRRLERLLRAVWAKAINEDHPDQMAAQQRALAVIDRHIKLMGLDAPAEHRLEVTPMQSEIESLIAAITGTSELPEEIDIFEADVVEVREIG